MSIDRRIFRQTVGCFATGVTVIAADVDDDVKAMTANSFTSLSLEPPLVLVCIGKHTKTGQQIQAADRFSINILRHDQEALSTFFAGDWQEPEPPPFQFERWNDWARLDRCAAAMGCVRHAIYEGGDHWIVVGRVLALHRGAEPRKPLVFFDGRYARLDNGGGPAPDL